MESSDTRAPSIRIFINNLMEKMRNELADCREK